MPRPRKKRRDLPERVYFRHGAYYFVDRKGLWIHLGREHQVAMSAWLKLLELPEKAQTVDQLLNKYAADIVPHKAPRTQKGNLAEIAWLRTAFAHMRLDEVRPHDIAQYRDTREAKTRANREIALLSHAFNKAMEWGWVDRNPCAGVKLNKEKPRDRYVEDHEIEAFKKFCPDWLRIYIDLKLLLALRQQDMLALQWSEFESDRINVFIKKVGKRAAFVNTDEIKETLSKLKREASDVYVFQSRTGGPRSESHFRTLWSECMTEYAKAGGIRFTEHDLRGKVATDIDDPYRAQRLLVHSSINTTEGYMKQRKIDVIEPNSRRKKNGTPD